MRYLFSFCLLAKDYLLCYLARLESLIGLVNRIQLACTAFGYYGSEGMSLWEALPSVTVVGGQSSRKSRFGKAWWGEVSCLVDPKEGHIDCNTHDGCL